MEEPLELLQRRLEGRSQRSLAKEMGVTVQYLNDVIHGRRPPGPKILKALGLEREVLYRPVDAP